MALITCPDCNKAVSEHATECPHCGRNVQQVYGSRPSRINATARPKIPNVHPISKSDQEDLIMENDEGHFKAVNEEPTLAGPSVANQDVELVVVKETSTKSGSVRGFTIWLIVLVGFLFAGFYAYQFWLDYEHTLKTVEVKHEPFSIRMPTHPMETKQNIMLEDQLVPITIYVLDQGKYQYGFSVTQYSEAFVKEQGVQAILEQTMDRILKTNDDQLLRSNSIEKDSFRGIQFTSVTPTSKKRFGQLFLVNSNLIAVLLVGPNEKSTEEECKFYGSSLKFKN